MKSTRAGVGVPGGIRSAERGVLGAEACGIMSGGSILSRGEAGVVSVVGGRYWNPERERLRRLEANLDAHREHVVQLFVREAAVAPSL